MKTRYIRGRSKVIPAPTLEPPAFELAKAENPCREITIRDGTFHLEIMGLRVIADDRIPRDQYWVVDETGQIHVNSITESSLRLGLARQEQGQGHISPEFSRAVIQVHDDARHVGTEDELAMLFGSTSWPGPNTYLVSEPELPPNERIDEAVRSVVDDRRDAFAMSLTGNAIYEAYRGVRIPTEILEEDNPPTDMVNVEIRVAASGIFFGPEDEDLTNSFYQAGDTITFSIPRNAEIHVERAQQSNSHTQAGGRLTTYDNSLCRTCILRRDYGGTTVICSYPIDGTRHFPRNECLGYQRG